MNVLKHVVKDKHHGKQSERRTKQKYGKLMKGEDNFFLGRVRGDECGCGRMKASTKSKKKWFDEWIRLLYVHVTKEKPSKKTYLV